MTTTKLLYSARVIRAAAALDARFCNPQVAAMNRIRKSKSDRSKKFWQLTIHALHRPYTCWTDHEIATWKAIRERQQSA